MVDIPDASFRVNPDSAVALELVGPDDEGGFFCTVAGDSVGGYDIAGLIGYDAAILEGQAIAGVEVAKSADIDKTLGIVLHNNISFLYETVCIKISWLD